MSDNVHIDQKAVDEMFRDENGIIGDYMRLLANRIADVARIKVRTRTIGRHREGRTSNAKPPGYTRANITTTVGHAKTRGGLLFGGANAPENPGLFLELPAEQIALHNPDGFPFLTTGLWSVTLD